MGLNHLYYRLKPDGLALHIIAPLAILRQLLGDPSVRPDVRKLTWVGTASHESTVCFVRHDGRYQRFDDMIGAKESLIVGATPGGTREYYPKLLKEVLGANLKIVTGYKSAGPFYAALESGEVEAACGFGWNVLKGERPHWIKEKIMRVFLQLNPAEKDSELPDVPWVMDYVKTPAQRQLIQAGMGTQIINRTFVAAPGIPADRARILRRAFMDTMKDPEFLADAARTKIDINPRTNSEIETLIKEWFSLPLESVEKLRKIFFPAGF